MRIIHISHYLISTLEWGGGPTTAGSHTATFPVRLYLTPCNLYFLVCLSLDIFRHCDRNTVIIMVTTSYILMLLIRFMWCSLLAPLPCNGIPWGLKFMLIRNRLIVSDRLSSLRSAIRTPRACRARRVWRTVALRMGIVPTTNHRCNVRSENVNCEHWSRSEKPFERYSRKSALSKQRNAFVNVALDLLDLHLCTPRQCTQLHCMCNSAQRDLWKHTRTNIVDH